MDQRVKTEDLAQRDVQYYLRAWRIWTRNWRPQLWWPNQVPLVKIMVPIVSWDSAEDQNAQADAADEQISEYILEAVNCEVEALEVMKCAAVHLVYLNETGPAVYRSGRMSLEKAAQLCDEAEREMIPRLRTKGIILGGY